MSAVKSRVVARQHVLTQGEVISASVMWVTLGMAQLVKASNYLHSVIIA